MRFRLLILSLLLIASFSNSFSQDISVPADPVLNSKEDYARYEKDIIAAANWLKAVPLNEQADKHKEVYAFIIKWVGGSPTVNVELTPVLLDFEKKNGGMMVLYMAFCAKYVLENNYSSDATAKKTAALRDLIAVYKSGTGIKKDKKMDKLVDAEAAGKLDEWIAENMKTKD